MVAVCESVQGSASREPKEVFADVLFQKNCRCRFAAVIESAVLPEIHLRPTFRESFIAVAHILLDFFWKCGRLFRMRPVLVVGLVLLWGGMFLSWKIKPLVVPGQIIWVAGLVMWLIGMRPPKR